jgi:hypothetical protein
MRQRMSVRGGTNDAVDDYLYKLSFSLPFELRAISCISRDAPLSREVLGREFVSGPAS